MVNRSTGQQKALYSPGKLVTSESATDFILLGTTRFKKYCLAHAQLDIGDRGKQ